MDVPQITVQGEFSLSPLLKSSWPLLGVAMTGLVMEQAATIFLGVWDTAQDVGIFDVANRVASLLLFPLMAMMSILAPKFAAMHRQRDMDGLKKLPRSSSRMLTFFAVPVAVLVAINAEWIIAIFGPGFKDGAIALGILLIGVVINAATWPVGTILMMPGFEYVLRKVMIISAFLMILLSAILIPPYCFIGAGIAAMVGSGVQNGYMTLKVWKCLGFWPMFIGR